MEGRRQQVAWQARRAAAVAVNISALSPSLKRADEILELLPREPSITGSRWKSPRPKRRAIRHRLLLSSCAAASPSRWTTMGWASRTSNACAFCRPPDRRWLVARLSTAAGPPRRRDVVALAAERSSRQAEGQTEQQWHALELGCVPNRAIDRAPIPGDRVRGWIGRMQEAGRYPRCAG
jgi:hypothetical protein